MENFWLSVRMQEKQAEIVAVTAQARRVQIAKQVSRRQSAPIVRRWLGLTLIKLGRRISRHQTRLTIDNCEM